MGITYGDHLIDSGYYDITPEQEREIDRLQARIELLEQRLEFAEFEWNRATAGMQERDADIERLRLAVLRIDAINDNPAHFISGINDVCDEILRPNLNKPSRKWMEP